LTKIIKFVPTRCQNLRIKCTKFNFGRGSGQDPAGEAYSAFPDPLAGFRVPGYFQGRERKGRVEEGEERRVRRKKRGPQWFFYNYTCSKFKKYPA